MKKTYFALADIHSYYDAMISALQNKGFDIMNPDHIIIICGDLFDRGPDAKACLEFVQHMAAANRLVYIMGNHEILLLHALRDLRLPSSNRYHHYTNGTLDTISQFTGISWIDLLHDTFNYHEVEYKMQPVLDFIAANVKYYFEIDKFIFCHGWVPCIGGQYDFYDNIHIAPLDWWVDSENYHCADVWEEATWINGLKAWERGARIKNKFIVCGHIHAGYGHARIHKTCSEFPKKECPKWQESFEPFVDNGIIALDAATAYSGFCNCLVLEI